MASIQLEPELLEGRAGETASSDGRALDAHGLLVRRRALVRRTLIAADLLAVAGAFFVALLVFGPIGGSTAPFEFRLLLASLPAWIAVASLNDLYRPDTERTHHPTTDDLVGILQPRHRRNAAVLRRPLRRAPRAAGSRARAGIVDPGDHAHRRSAACARGRGSGAARRTSQRTIIVGAGDVGQLVARKIMQHPEYGIDLVGFVDDAPKQTAAEPRPARRARRAGASCWRSSSSSTSTGSSSRSRATRTRRRWLLIARAARPRRAASTSSRACSSSSARA